MYFTNSGVFLIIFRSLNAITIPCNETYKAQNGRLCYPCSPGFHKFSDCVKDNVTARCTKCGTGEYQPNCDNSTECLRCRTHCPTGQDKVKECSDTSDIECKCTSGRFWQPDKGKPGEGYCIKHSRCIAGEGVSEKGTPFKNTKCVQCKKGVTYSDKASFDTCTTCSQCNTTIVQKCSLTRDTVCDDQNSGVSRSPFSTEKSRSGLDGGVVALIVIVGLILVIIVVIVAVVWYRRNNQCQFSRGIYDITSSGLHALEQSYKGNGSKESSKQNWTKSINEQDQEVSENAGHAVLENGIAQYNKNGYQQNRLQNNNDILNQRTKAVSQNGVGTYFREEETDKAVVVSSGNSSIDTTMSVGFKNCTMTVQTKTGKDFNEEISVEVRSRPLHEKHINILAKYVGKNWEHLMFTLQLNQATIDQIQEDYNNTVARVAKALRLILYLECHNHTLTLDMIQEASSKLTTHIEWGELIKLAKDQTFWDQTANK